MAEVKVYNMDGKEVSTLQLNDSIWGVEINDHLVHKAVVEILNNKRQGTKKQKTRAEVRGGDKKPWKQKGTGHARQGSIRAPQWKGGGVVFAALPKEYSSSMNKKEKVAALKSVLTSLVNDGKLCVVDEITFADYKTKNMVKLMKNLNLDKALLVLDKKDDNVVISCRNLPNVATGSINEMNVYDLLKCGKLLMTEKAVKSLEEVYA